ncbi:MAG TPA: hypothetical protein VGS19_31700 [Streptosporangiaceae bacterium]|nr:hypothetical protein [Streptosporangiaceae bacterium]
MSTARPGDPFAVLGLPAEPGLGDDDVRAAWRRIAAATHPDRADGGNPAVFAEAAAAYTVLRTGFGRSEALADLAAPRRGLRPGRRRPRPRPAPAPGSGRLWPALRLLPAIAPWWARLQRQPGWLAARRLLAQVRRGRPTRLAARVAATAVVSAAAVWVAGARPATPAVIAGALTWLVLTAHHDIARH